MIKPAKQSLLQQRIAATMLPYAQAVKPHTPPKPAQVHNVSLRAAQEKAEWWLVRVANRRTRDNLKRGEINSARTAHVATERMKRAEEMHRVGMVVTTTTPTVESVRAYLAS